MKALLLKFRADARGSTAIEYGLIAGLIFIAIVGALSQIGTRVENNLSVAVEALEQ
jgi:pilus assembly protein Flp/PilA